MEWEHSVVMMSIHKMLEVLEKINKDESLSSTDVRMAKDASQAICNLMGIKQHLDK